MVYKIVHIKIISAVKAHIF